MNTLIIGGGAAGLMLAARLGRAGMRVTLCEKQDRVGRKLLSTGNGRCNLTNRDMNASHYSGDTVRIGELLRRCAPESVTAFLEEIGLYCRTDEESRVYPVSNQAAGVLDALRFACDEAGVETLTSFEVRNLTRKKGRWEAVSADGRKAGADIAVVACGGLAAPKLGAGGDGYRLLEAFGHTVTARYPAIVPLKVDEARVRPLKGIRMHARVQLLADDREVRSEEGEILFNDGVLSGIACMQLAGEANALLAAGKKVQARMDFAPELPPDGVVQLARRLEERGLEDLLSGLVPRRLGQVLIKEAGIAPLSRKAGELSFSQLRSIERKIRGWTLEVRGTGGYDAAQVTRGGVPLREFTPSLESLRAPGLFGAGELLDAAGDCGGYNLHFAWTCAFVIADEILSRSGK